jgi:putative ABC transport system permease protein
MTRPPRHRPMAVRLLRLLTVAFPGPFRRRYASEMLDVFEERYTAMRAHRSRWALSALWVRTCRDILVSAAMERARALRRRGPRRGDTTTALPTPPRHRSEGTVLHSVLMDTRYAARGLRRKPGFTAVATATLALGIGANTAIFSVVNDVLLRPLPYDHPEELVRIWSRNPGEGRERYYTSPLSFNRWREEIDAVEDIAAAWPRDVTLTDDENLPVRLKAMSPTPNWFSVLGLTPLLGRTFNADDGAWDAPFMTVILGYGVWRQRYGGDPGVIGRTVQIEGQPARIVGVMPRGTEFPEATQLWTAFLPPRTQPAQYLDVIGRLKPGVSLEAGLGEMERIARGLEEEFPRVLNSWSVDMAPLQAVVVGDVRPALLIMLGATALVLVIACANVANLVLARTEARHREIAVRAALGAGRGRLMRQLLTENLVLAAVGTAVGVVVAVAGLQALVALAPATLPHYDGVALSLPVLLVALGSAVATGLAFGLAPALHLMRLDLQSDLREGGQRGARGRGQGLRGGFVVTQLALTVMVAIGAGLLVKSFLRLRSTDPGFDPAGLLTFELNLPPGAYRELGTVRQTYDLILDRLNALPGVQRVGMTSSLPMSDPLDYLLGVWVVGAPPVAAGEEPTAWYRQVSPEFFAAMGIPLLQGRPFGNQDTPDAPGVVIINRALARTLFDEGDDPVGRRLQGISGDFGPLGQVVNEKTEIVGVVDDVRYGDLRTTSAPSLYFPHAQAPFRRMTVALRTSGDPTGLVAPVRAEVASVDANLPLGNVTTMQQTLERSLARDRFAMFLVGLFGILALVLASVGIYGVLSYTVAERTNELGIRMALGATGRNVLRLVIRQSLTLIGLGVTGGIAGALLLTRLMSSQLYGVTARDPLTFGAVTVVLTAVALVASYLPAVRATRVDPMSALRYD